MTVYLSNRDGNGKTSEEGHYKFQTAVFAGNVLGSGLTVSQNSPLGMSVIVAAGQYKIDTSSDYSYTGWNTANEVVNISTADAANPRISSIVLYVDKGAATSPSPPNNPGITKLMSVNGTPAAVPAAPNSTTIQSAVGAGNPYIILANVRANAAATTITDANITDTRTLVTVGTGLVNSDSLLDASVTADKLADSSVTTNKINNLAVTTAKLADGAATDAKWRNGIAFYARRTGTRSISAATFTLFACDTILYNLGSGYSNASNIGRFTAPVAGVYSFYACLNSSAAANTRTIIELRINGSANNSRAFDVTSTQNRNQNATTFALMNAGDYCEAFAWTSVATNIASSSTTPTEFGGFLVTRT